MKSDDEKCNHGYTAYGYRVIQNLPFDVVVGDVLMEEDVPGGYFTKLKRDNISTYNADRAIGIVEEVHPNRLIKVRMCQPVREDTLKNKKEDDKNRLAKIDYNKLAETIRETTIIFDEIDQLKQNKS